jgi:uncharacterized membrane protein YeaQ/YmgE (transglycosylase-associated protein family)
MNSGGQSSRMNSSIREGRYHFPAAGRFPMDTTAVHQFIEMCLTWVGFGVVCGLMAKAILPGRDPGGAVVTIILGIAGALIGAAAYAWAAGHALQMMISLTGFAVSTGGSLVLLLMHRLMSGRMYGRRPAIIEEVMVPAPRYSRRRSTRYSDVD